MGRPDILSPVSVVKYLNAENKEFYNKHVENSKNTSLKEEHDKRNKEEYENNKKSLVKGKKDVK